MGHQLIREPKDDADGEPLFCVFSSIVDNIVLYNASYDEVVHYYVEKAEREARERTERWLAEVLGTSKGIPLRQMNYDEMLEKIKIVHGGKESKKVRRMIEEQLEEKDAEK